MKWSKLIYIYLIAFILPTHVLKVKSYILRIPSNHNSPKWMYTANIWNIAYWKSGFVLVIETYISYPINIWVSIVSPNIESTVLNNGNTSKYFKLQRGVRQGCPLYAYLFIIALETLANKIRNDTNIKGIKIDNKEIKINLLADDITLILLDQNSVKHSGCPKSCFSMCRIKH